MSAIAYDPNLARVIEEARTRSQITKFKLAVRSGLSLQTVNMACKGLATLRTLTALSKVLGVDVDTLTGRRNPNSVADEPGAK